MVLGIISSLVKAEGDGDGDGAWVIVDHKERATIIFEVPHASKAKKEKQGGSTCFLGGVFFLFLFLFYFRTRCDRLRNTTC